MANSAAFRTPPRENRITPFDANNVDDVALINTKAEEEFNMRMYEQGLETS